MTLNRTADWQRLSPKVSQMQAERHVRGILDEFPGTPRACPGGLLQAVRSDEDVSIELLIYSKRRWLTLIAAALVKVNQINSSDLRDGLIALPVAEHAYELILGQQVDLAFRADLPFLVAIARSLVGRIESAAHRLSVQA